MAADYQVLAEQIKRLASALSGLAPTAAALGVGPPDGQEWYELLRHKLLPQVEAPPLMVVAVVGGTNIGKSVVFNHLAGEQASGVSPLASKTKHPVCLVPRGADEPALLARLFAGFHVRPWQSTEDPWTLCDEHQLYWRLGANASPRLLILDTPDIDSDAEVNWQRADAIRQSADVLIAVLTQQKYNDAAVKKFFRKAAEADKPVMVVFNQVDLVEDRAFWPEWLATFASETKADVQQVFVAPHDRAAAGALALPFYAVGADGREAVGKPSDLRTDLAALHFDAIKVRTFRGAVGRVIDREHGAPAYLASVNAASGAFSAAAQALAATPMARVRWPSVPTPLLVEEIQQWWDNSRAPWLRKVHGAYRQLGQVVTWPFRKAVESVRGPAVDPVQSFREAERTVILQTIEGLLAELERLSEMGNDLLRPRLKSLLGGDARARLLRRMESLHAELPAIGDDYRAFVGRELERWSKENPTAVAFLRSLDHAAAVARPAITVTLAVSGWGFAGDAIGQAAAGAATHTVGTIATEAAITGGITAGGEAAVATIADKGARQSAALLFRRLQDQYAGMRADWLRSTLEREFLGGLLDELRQGAEASASAAYTEARASLAALAEQAHRH